MPMTRQESLEIIWKKLVIIIIIILAIVAVVMAKADSTPVLIMIFISGNLGGYVAIHKNLSDYTDQEINQLSKSWFGILLPPIIGGILSMVMYLLFISNIISGELFPEIDLHSKISSKDYAKLLFWGFVAGFNEKYVSDVIDTIRERGGPLLRGETDDDD